MSIVASLLLQPKHCIMQKSRAVPYGASVRVAKNQDRTTPLNTVVQRAGAKYESRVGEYLQKVIVDYQCILYSHTWFSVGNSIAQTDFFLVFPSGATILFEVKQTWVDTTEQLMYYKYILIELGFTPITCCTICKNLTAETPRATIINSFEDIKENATWQLRL